MSTSSTLPSMRRGIARSWISASSTTGASTTPPRAATRGRVRDGLIYVRRRPDIMLVLVIAFMHGTFGMNFQLFNALMSTEVFGKGVQDFGITGSVMAIGSLAGALMAARRAENHHGAGRLFVGRNRGGDATLMLSDARGKPRMQLKVTPGGAASIDFLDEQGEVTGQVTPETLASVAAPRG